MLLYSSSKYLFLFPLSCLFFFSAHASVITYDSLALAAQHCVLQPGAPPLSTLTVYSEGDTYFTVMDPFVFYGL